jgi:HlyD family secretion protein
MATVEVDRGDVVQVVTENGSIECSDDSVVRSRVESFLGIPIAGPKANPIQQLAQARDGRAMPSRAAAARAATSAANTGSTGGSQTNDATLRGRRPIDAQKPKAPRKITAMAAASPIAAPLNQPDSTASSKQSNDPTTSWKGPDVRSFQYVVEPYVPLRAGLPAQEAGATAPPAPPAIVSILPEGSRVKAGAVVCQLDSSAFRDALPLQKIRYIQAKSRVEQTRSMLEASQIALREFEQGIFPQDVKQLKDYIAVSEFERDRARRNAAWSQAAAAKGFRTSMQVDADRAALADAEFTVRAAQAMLVRLQKHTGKRVAKACKAKIEAIKADLLALESCLLLEGQRVRRIETMIANCTLRAPHDGIVVYANRTNAWGMTLTQIREGLLIRQSQPVFRLLDPKRLFVQARINESQVAQVRSGQQVAIRLEAFPDRLLRGSVSEITPVPSLANGPFSDVRTYSAKVRIESGQFEELRSGLTAELDFLVLNRRHVTRVPLEAIRWRDDQPYVAVADGSESGIEWEWRAIDVGANDTAFAEVTKGLVPGDRVVAQCDRLPDPEAGAAKLERTVEVAMRERR